MNLEQVNKLVKCEKNKNWRDKNPKQHKRNHQKAQWKSQGIIVNDFDKAYTNYIKCMHCEYCDRELKNNKDRQMDHDHSITIEENIRGVLCARCNLNDVFKNYFNCLEKYY